MKKIFVLTIILLSGNFYSLQAAQASLEDKDAQAIKQIEALAQNLKELKIAKEYCTTHIERLEIEDYATLNLLSKQLETMRVNSMAPIANLAFDLIGHDRIAPLKKLLSAAKSTNTLDQKALTWSPWPDNKIALLPFAAYAVSLNQENCIPILKTLECHGIDLTAPVIISGQKADSRVKLTNALEIAREHNKAVFEFLLPQRNWSLEDAQRIIEPLQPKADSSEPDFSAAAAAAGDDRESTVLESMMAKAKLASETPKD